MSGYETVWAKLDSEDGSYLSERKTHGKFVPITPQQHEYLRVAMDQAIVEQNDDGDYDNQYFLERLEATHFYIFVTEPDGVHGVDYDDESTWWDFACIVSKQVGDDWYAWSEDPGDTQNVWYQSTYTKAEAYAVRDLCIEWAERGCLYNDPSVPHQGGMKDLTQDFYNAVSVGPMAWW